MKSKSNSPRSFVSVLSIDNNGRWGSQKRCKNFYAL